MCRRDNHCSSSSHKRMFKNHVSHWKDSELESIPLQRAKGSDSRSHYLGVSRLEEHDLSDLRGYHVEVYKLRYRAPSAPRWHSGRIRTLDERIWRGLGTRKNQEPRVLAKVIMPHHHTLKYPRLSAKRTKCVAQFIFRPNHHNLIPPHLSSIIHHLSSPLYFSSPPQTFIKKCLRRKVIN